MKREFVNANVQISPVGRLLIVWGPHLVLIFKHSISTCQSKPFATSIDTNSEGNLLSVQR